MKEFLVIDADAHVLEPTDLWLRYMDGSCRGHAPRVIEDECGFQRILIDGRVHPRHHYGLNGMGSAGQSVNPPVIKLKKYEDGKRGGFDPIEHLKDMDLEGIDVAVLFPTLGMFLGGLKDIRLAEETSIAYNNWLADYCSANPRRLKGCAHVPLQDVPTAVREMRRAVTELGMVGVYLRPNPYSRRNWDDPEYYPFWEAVEELNVFVGFHEGASGAMPIAAVDRYEEYSKTAYNHLICHIVSHPFEQQLTSLTLICGGVFEKFPGLKVALLESGVGWMPYWLERMDRDFEHLGWYAPFLKMKPSQYFKRHCLVSCDPDEEAIPYALKMIGDDNIIFASDYPHFDATFPGAVAGIAERDEISDTSKMKILGLNAAKLIRLPVGGFLPEFRGETQHAKA
jgi:predicted TIM-barrel fold metal-dependent hydrolase